MTTKTAMPNWRKLLAAYQKPDLSRSVLEIVCTVIPLAVFWGAALWFSLTNKAWAALLCCVPASVFLVRMFLIQHDCGHQSFFRSSFLNNWVGRLIGVITFTPYDVWRRTHAIHHASSGNLDRRGLGAIDTLTVEEYSALSPFRRFGYRLYRHPLVIFILGPAFVFFFDHRVPSGIMKEGWRPWLSAMGTNVAIAALTVAMVFFVGWKPILFVIIPSVFLASALGVWLFYVQHQFEEVLWFRNKDWNHTSGALYGSSYYELPKPLAWLTGHIGIHHVHHAASRIPFYRLPQVLKDYPQLKSINKLTLKESFRCIKLALWDEDGQKMISFRQLKQQAAAG